MFHPETAEQVTDSHLSRLPPRLSHLDPGKHWRTEG